jgi:hypothetical protein
MDTFDEKKQSCKISRDCTFNLVSENDLPEQAGALQTPTLAAEAHTGTVLHTRFMKQLYWKNRGIYETISCERTISKLIKNRLQ